MTPLRPSLRPLLRFAAAWLCSSAVFTSARAQAEASASEHPVMDAPLPTAVEIHSLLKLGATMTERGEYDSGDIAFRQVLASPDATPAETKSALLGLAHLYRRQGTLIKAVAVYEKFLQQFPNDESTPDALLDLGRALRAMGSNRLAITRFYSVINSTLKLPAEGFARYQQLAKTAQFEIAETHFQAGEFAEAAKYFSRLRLLDLTPADQARAQFKAAYSVDLQGDHEAAVTQLRVFLEQWPKDENVPEARYLLATTLRSLQRPQEALAVTLDLLRAEKSLTAGDPKRWAYWQRRTGNQLANDFFEHGDILNAHAIYAGLAALSDDPEWRLPVVYQIGLCHERLGALDRAHAAYQSIVDAAKKAPSPTATELGRMAAWRISHLDWTESTRHQITTLFETSTGRVTPETPVAKPAAPL